MSVLAVYKTALWLTSLIVIVCVSIVPRAHSQGHTETDLNQPTDLYLLQLHSCMVNTTTEMTRAGQLAVEEVNSQIDLLPGYTLKLLESEQSECVSTEDNSFIVNYVSEVFQSGKCVVGIIGPGCLDVQACEFISAFSAKEKVALVNLHLTESPTGGVPYSFGLLETAEVLANAVLQLMRENNLSRFLVVYETTFESTGIHFEDIQRNSSTEENITLVLSEIDSLNGSVLHLTEENDIRTILAFASHEKIGRLLCIAQQKGLVYPHYQWIFVNRGGSLKDVLTEEQYPCTIDQVRVAANGTLFIQYRLTPHSSSSYSMQDAVNIRLFSLPLTALYYDSVWAFSLALNQSLYIPVSRQKNDSSIMCSNRVTKEELLHVAFTGISGNIRFNSLTHNVRRLVDISQVLDNATHLVAYYNPETGLITNTTSLQYTQTYEYIRVGIATPLGASLLCILLTTVLLTITIVGNVLALVYRQEKAVRASSSNLVKLAWIGCYLISVGNYFFVARKWSDYHPNFSINAALNRVVEVSVSVGFTLLFGAFLTRTWRIYRIFVHYRNPGRFLSDFTLIAVVITMAAIDVVLVSIWSIVDPYKWTVKQSVIHKTKITQVREKVRYITDHYPQWFVVIIGFNAIIMALMLLISVFTQRRIPKAQRDFNTRQIIVTIYLLGVISGLGFTIFFFLNQNTNTPIVVETLVLSLTFDLCILVCNLTLFLPPIVHVLHQRRDINTVLYR